MSSSPRPSYSTTDRRDTAKPEQQGTSIGTRVGQGLFGAVKLIQGIGETIRGLIIDVADLGKGSGKQIAEDGKVEAREGIRQVEGSIRR